MPERRPATTLAEQMAELRGAVQDLGTARERLTELLGQHADTAEGQARLLLTAALLAGTRDVRAILLLAAEVDVSERTLRRAKASLHLQAERSGFGPGGSWTWHPRRPGTP